MTKPLTEHQKEFAGIAIDQIAIMRNQLGELMLMVEGAEIMQGGIGLDMVKHWRAAHEQMTLIQGRLVQRYMGGIAA